VRPTHGGPGATAQPLDYDQSGQWLWRPRAYIPVGLSRGWTFTQRIDLSLSCTHPAGSDNPNGTWKAGIGDGFVEEIVTTPELAENLRLWASVRFVLPTRGPSPFRSNQYQWAPVLSATYAPPERWSLTFYPENAPSYNGETHKWFVPIDLMLIRRLTQTVELGIGGAYVLVDGDPLYRSLVYGRVTFHFRHRSHPVPCRKS